MAEVGLRFQVAKPDEQDILATFQGLQLLSCVWNKSKGVIEPTPSGSAALLGASMSGGAHWSGRGAVLLPPVYVLGSTSKEPLPEASKLEVMRQKIERRSTMIARTSSHRLLSLGKPALVALEEAQVDSPGMPLVLNLPVYASESSTEEIFPICLPSTISQREADTLGIRATVDMDGLSTPLGRD